MEKYSSSVVLSSFIGLEDGKEKEKMVS